MNFKYYINLYQLLQNDTSTKEERRIFRLSLDKKIKKPIHQLFAWQERISLICQKPFLSDTISIYLYKITFTFVLIAFIIGIISGSMLLSYSGKEPVNVVYFMTMVIIFPLFTMFLTLISMFKVNNLEAILIHFSPSFWMEKIFNWIEKKEHLNLDVLKINPLLFNWLLIKRSQLIALFFSLGLFFSLLGVVATKDIAFAWSTTLQITAQELYDILYYIATPWRDYLPSAVPSLELIEQSHYFRLGDRLNHEMIENASKLGAWWKFLAICTLFYSIILRSFIYLISSIGFDKALKKSFWELEGVRKLILDMNEVIISTTSIKKEKKFIPSIIEDMEKIEVLEEDYKVIQGWSLLNDQLLEINNFMDISSSLIFSVGGGNSLQDDTKIIKQSLGKVLLYVKSWEPPTMDFMDYIDELLPNIEQLIVYPIGTSEDKYNPKSRELDIWERKISQLKNKKVWIKR